MSKKEYKIPEGFKHVIGTPIGIIKAGIAYECTCCKKMYIVNQIVTHTPIVDNNTGIPIAECECKKSG